MNVYYLSVGSNIKPSQNVPKIIKALLDINASLIISRVVETEPVGICSSNRFLNCIVRLETHLLPHPLKQSLNHIEEMLGRDRTDPLKKVKDRTADIDILSMLEKPFIHDTELPDEPYLRMIVLELLHQLGIGFALQIPSLPRGKQLKINNCEFGLHPTILTSTGESITTQHLPSC